MSYVHHWASRMEKNSNKQKLTFLGRNRLPYKDQSSANSERGQLDDVSRKVNTEVLPIYTSRKIKDEIKVKEQKPPVFNQQCAVKV